jgi:hypothetical protein
VRELSVWRVILECVEVTAVELARIPAGNLRVPREDFTVLWVAAERTLAERPRDWAAYGVVATCRWLAAATVPTITGGWEIAKAPVTRRTGVTYEELIEAECLAAEKLAARQPVPAWLRNQPGWLAAVLATLGWVWRRTGPPPLPLAAPGQG